jgi:mono/diheme cytochrome c family protein
MRSFLYGIVFCLVVLVAGFYVYLRLGGMPVGTRSAPLPLEKFIARTALHVAMEPEIDKPSPVDASEPSLLAGAKVYKTHCAVCHGALGGQPTAIAQGMFPPPPQLMPPKKGVTDDPVGETYWKVKNGIRLTGMPSFDGALSDTEMWQVSQLLLNAAKVPESVAAELR